MGGYKFDPMDILRPGGDLRFYQSTLWRHKRAEVLKRDRYECTRCAELGRYSKAQCVHHIIHLKNNPTLALQDMNLTSLCNECHNAVHPEKFSHDEPYVNKEWF